MNSEFQARLLYGHPNGSYLAAGLAGDRRAIVLRSVDGALSLHRPDAWPSGVVWSPSGEAIAFSTPEGVSVCSAVTGEALAVLECRAMAGGFDWHDDERLVVPQLTDRGSAWVMWSVQVPAPPAPAAVWAAESVPSLLIILGQEGHRIALATGLGGLGGSQAREASPASWTELPALANVRVGGVVRGPDRQACLLFATEYRSDLHTYDAAILHVGLHEHGLVVRPLYLGLHEWATWLTATRVAVLDLDGRLRTSEASGGQDLVCPHGVTRFQPTSDPRYIYALLNQRVVRVDIETGSICV